MANSLILSRFARREPWDSEKLGEQTKRAGALRAHASDPHKGPYNADAFHVDIEKRRAVCPQGHLSTPCSRIRDVYLGTEYYRIEWASQCDSCPVQKQCTRSKSGRRTLVVGLRYDLVEKQREEMRKTELSKSMHPRNGIEGTHGELVRGHGLRRTK
ncbi:MAG TPA: transposase [Candidatus Binatia bacterium]|nr:transposase [Candidatus Binatia bacterium]